MKILISVFVLLLVITACSAVAPKATDNATGWEIDFFDDFDSFNSQNWQDQMLWVNDEDQCYVPNNEFNTREVSEGTIKLRVVDLGEKKTLFECQ